MCVWFSPPCMSSSFLADSELLLGFPICRHEMQAQQQRQRLMSDADNRVEEAERQRRADRQRLEAALERSMDEAAQREAVARAAADERLSEAQRSHAKALAQAREEWDARQEGWRAAVAEKASQEVSCAALR